MCEVSPHICNDTIAPRHVALYLSISASCRTIVKFPGDLPLDTLIPAPCHCFGSLGVPPFTYVVFTGNLPHPNVSPGVSPILPKTLSSCHLYLGLLCVLLLANPSTYLLRRLASGSLGSSKSCRTLRFTLWHLVDYYITVNDTCSCPSPTSKSTYVLCAYHSSPRSCPTFSSKSLCVRLLCSLSSFDAEPTIASLLSAFIAIRIWSSPTLLVPLHGTSSVRL